MEQAQGNLSGVRVLDLTQYLSGHSALLLMAGLGAGFTLTNWATIQPAPGESSAVHVLVFENWQKIRVRFWARAAKAGENAERPSESQQQPAN